VADYYEVLGVSSQATQDQIKRAFRERAMRYHPDRNPGNPEAEALFKQLNEAYQVLSDPDLRARYDGRFTQFFGGASEQASSPDPRERRRRRAQQHYQQQEYRRQAGPRKPEAPPMPLWKGYLLLFGIVAAISGVLFGLMAFMHRREAENRYQEALALYAQGENMRGGALRALSIAMDHDAEHAGAHALYADVLLDMGKFEEAVHYARQAVDLSDPPLPADYLRLAIGLQSTGQPHEAYHCLKKVLAEDPSNPRALFMMGEAELYAYRNYREALVHFDALLALGRPYDPELWLAKGVALQELREYAEADRCFRKVVDGRPLHGVARYYMGKLQLEYHRDTAQACAFFEFARQSGVEDAKWYLFQYCASQAGAP
jgi:tetratricopeptide (TPR) repeat protein